MRQPSLENMSLTRSHGMIVKQETETNWLIIKAISCVWRQLFTNYNTLENLVVYILEMQRN